MNFNKKIFGQFMEDDFVHEFLESHENQTRYSISAISSICSDLVEADTEECTQDFRDECVNKIMNHCFRMMKLTEIYSMLADAYDKENELSSETMELNNFLCDFVQNCSMSLEKVCEITFIAGEAAVKRVSEKFLTFALLMYVRYAVVNGAKKIDVSLELENDAIVISMMIRESGACMGTDIMPEFITVDYACDLISFAAEKINSNFLLVENGMEFRIPADKNGDSYLRSPETRQKRRIFNPFNNMLADLSDITII